MCASVRVHLGSRVPIHRHVRTADASQIIDPALIELNPFRWHVANVETVTQENRRYFRSSRSDPLPLPDSHIL